MVYSVLCGLLAGFVDYRIAMAFASAQSGALKALALAGFMLFPPACVMVHAAVSMRGLVAFATSMVCTLLASAAVGRLRAK